MGDLFGFAQGGPICLCCQSTTAWADNLSIRRVPGISNRAIGGPPLGRPRQLTELNKKELQALKRQQRQDEIDRIAVEGKFGQGKRRFTLARIMAKIAETSEAVIMVSVMVMNLEKILSSILLFLLGSYIDARQLFKATIRGGYKEIRKHPAMVIRHMLCRRYCLE